MFSQSEAIGSSTADTNSTTITISQNDPPIVSIGKPSPRRLAELVHHLSDVPVGEARRAVHRTGRAGSDDDPLSIVAAALLQLRRDTERCVSV